MEIRRLEVFCKVVEMKSFTRAAESVFLSQPSVSEHIRQLEESVEEKLLDRLGREVLPTPAGEILYRYARQILQLCDEAKQAMEQYRGKLAGALALGASTIPGAFVLPRLIEPFKRENPGIHLQLKIAGTGRIGDALSAGEIEIGVIGARTKDPALECEEVLSDELVLVVHPGHPWAGRDRLPAEELPRQQLIVREPGSGTRTVMERVLREQGVDPERLQVVAEMGSTEAVRQGVKAGLGGAVISALAVADDLRDGSLVRVSVAGVDMHRPFYLAWRKRRQLTPLAQAFLHHLRSSIGG